ncbi:MAG TPA: hypothetical protein VJR92_04325 [Gemmatimonadaceae bacterium]|nr:hypothetical protein [Gemmatimonadaceae bacterium]
MPRSKALAVAVYLGAVVIGAAAGIAVDRMFVRDPMNQNPMVMRNQFFTDLQFTPAQRTAWDSIRVAAQHADSVLHASIRAQLVPLRPQRDSIMKARDAALRALLTPEQQKMWDDRNARRQRSNDSRR